jgi:hypothetical protein
MNRYSQSQGGVSIAFDINFDQGTSLWTYQYTITDADGSQLAPGLSHIIVELSGNFLTDQGEISASGEIKFHPGNGQQGNPLLPISIFGIKINDPLANDVLSFTSDRAPMWGDVYMKAGPNNQNADTIWNTGLGANPSPLNLPLTPPAIAAGNASNWSDFANWLVVPDTTTSPPTLFTLVAPVPEAESFAVWAICFLVGGAFFLTQTRRRSRAHPSDF